MERTRIDAFRQLGIPVGSDRDTVVHAYRRLARAIHPDVSTDPAAADRFATLTEAYRLASEALPANPDPAGAGGADRRHAASAPAPERAPSDHRPAPWVLMGTADMPVASAGLVGLAPRWRRAPIVAGPVLVRPIHHHARAEASDG